jgi:hypothetical protein
VTSFKLFMAYPGVFMLDDASIFKALLRTGKNGGTICMHAENGGVIDVLVKKALAEGKTAPKYHALTRPADSAPLSRREHRSHVACRGVRSTAISRLIRKGRLTCPTTNQEDCGLDGANLDPLSRKKTPAESGMGTFWFQRHC